MGVLQQYEIAISHCCKRHDSLLGGALLLDASSSRCKCAAPSSSEAVRRTEIASSLRQSASWAKPFKGNHVVYSSTQWPFRTAVERPHRNRLCSTAVRNGNSVPVFSRFFRFFLTFLGDFNLENYHPEDSKHSGSRRIEFSSKSSTIADCEDNE